MKKEKFSINGNRDELKTKLKKDFPELTDDDLNFAAGNEEEFINLLEKKLGKTRPEVTVIIEQLQLTVPKDMAFTITTPEPTFKIRGAWDELKVKLKKKYSKLTDNDLAFSVGKEVELLNQLEKKLGIAPEEIIASIEELQLETHEEGPKKR